MTCIFLEDSFDSAHYLPNVPEGHKCHELHGHTYRIRMEVAGEVDDTSGWVMDYAKLRSVWLPIKADLDHKLLNEIIENPTCEIVAAWIAQNLKAEGLKWLTRIELRETEHCGVVYLP